MTEPKGKSRLRELAIARRKGQMPPIHQQVMNVAAATARAGRAVLRNEQVKVPPEVFDQRLAICKDCDHWINGRCELCGCYTAMKLRLATENCPIEKWTEYVPLQLEKGTSE